MDNSDLFVAMCLPGTFSPNNEGICHDCVRCLANQYEKVACIPTRDRTCANCTVCGTHDIELCQCAVKTSQCVTGDRVCLKVPPSVVNLVVDFTSNGVLSSKQQIFIRSGLAVGFTDWLAFQFGVDPETVELTDFVRTGQVTYQAYFRFNEVYGEATVTRIQSQPPEFFQGGIYYTFGGGGGLRRRLLEARGSRRLLEDEVKHGPAVRGRHLLQSWVGTGYLTANGASVSCDVNQTCTEPYTEFQFANGSLCTGFCGPVPCPPGYSGGPKDCQLCEPGTFKNESGYGDCLGCPADHTSPTGANSSEDCYPILTSTAVSSTAGEEPSTTSAPAASTTAALATTSTTAEGQTSATLQLSSSSEQSTSPSGTQPSTQTSSTAQQPSSTTSEATSSEASLPPATSSAPASSQPGTVSQEGSTSSQAATTSAAPGSSGPATTPPPTSSTAPAGGGGGGPGYPSSGSVVSSNVNTNTINNNPVVNVNVQGQPGQPPGQQAAQPVFNNYNYVSIEQPQRTPAEEGMAEVDHYHHYSYYGSRYVQGEDWGSLLFLFFFVSSFVFIVTCALATGCPYCCPAPPDPPRRRREGDRADVLFQLVPQQPPSGWVVTPQPQPGWGQPPQQQAWQPQAWQPRGWAAQPGSV